MVETGTATWPNHTTKCYYDSREGYWEIYTDEDGNCTSPYDFFWYDATDPIAPSGQMGAEDYYYDKTDPINDDNYGWPDPLEFDEYPLEIQCSSCFLFVPLLLPLPRSETRRKRISDPSWTADESSNTG
jgi:hypothetical protein